MAFTFDFTNSLIETDQNSVEVQDLLNAIRTAEESEIGITYDKIANASGKEQLTGSSLVGITLELLGDWQVKFEAGNYIATVSGGNLVGGPSGDPVAYSAGVQVLIVQSAAGTITQVSTGSGLSQEEHNHLMGLENGGGADAEAVASAVLDELVEDHQTPGSLGGTIAEINDKQEITLATVVSDSISN